MRKAEFKKQHHLITWEHVDKIYSNIMPVIFEIEAQIVVKSVEIMAVKRAISVWGSYEGESFNAILNRGQGEVIGGWIEIFLCNLPEYVSEALQRISQREDGNNDARVEIKGETVVVGADFDDLSTQFLMQGAFDHLVACKKRLFEMINTKDNEKIQQAKHCTENATIN